MQLTPEQYRILERGIRASHRRQQRITDPADLAELERLIENFGPAGLELAPGIKITRRSKHEPRTTKDSA